MVPTVSSSLPSTKRLKTLQTTQELRSIRFLGVCGQSPSASLALATSLGAGVSGSEDPSAEQEDGGEPVALVEGGSGDPERGGHGQDDQAPPPERRRRLVLVLQLHQRRAVPNSSPPTTGSEAAASRARRRRRGAPRMSAGAPTRGGPVGRQDPRGG